VTLDRGAQSVLACPACRPDGREDAAAAGVQLFVAGAAGAERELVDAVAAEGRVRVAVDEARDRAEPAAVHLDDLARDGGEVAHAPHRLDRLAAAEHVRVLDQLDLAERGPAQRRDTSRRCRELREIADQQPRGHASRGADGIFSPPRSAASSASPYPAST